MASWFGALTKTRDKLAGFFTKSTHVMADDQPVLSLDELEELLISADLPASLAMDLTKGLERLARKTKASLRDALASRLIEVLGETPAFAWEPTSDLQTILLVGINGSGKTTTAAKLAHLAQKRGRKPLLGAGDTFRAAGSSQLKLWAERVGCDAVGGQMGQDSAAVAFDSVNAAQARGCDTLIFDTAGRMHTKKPLMDELEKIRRSMGKACTEAPDHTWMVLDASLGQNAVIQASYFNEIVPLTGVVITKLDGSSKGGFLFAVQRELNVPIYFAGLGEQQEDLVPFNATEFVHALLGIEG